MKNEARISRVGNSFRVRVSGKPVYFSPREYGGEEQARAAALKYRDAHWDGSNRSQKLSDSQRAAVAMSTEDYRIVAARYGISPNYVHHLRRGAK